MYEPAATQRHRWKFFCAIMALVMGPVFLLIGIIFTAILSSITPVPGVVFLLAGITLTILGIALCIVIRRKTSDNPNNFSGQTLVSGAAPPGPVSGYHITMTSEQTHPQHSYPTEAASLQPSAPDALPPSYNEVTRKD